jgi:hypothetical protein
MLAETPVHGVGGNFTEAELSLDSLTHFTVSVVHQCRPLSRRHNAFVERSGHNL